MEELRLGAAELRFAELIWAHAPIASGELVKLCQQELQWKKSTTYTVLRRLCQRGLFQNTGGLVTVQLSREAFLAKQSESFVAEHFGGSLPLFLTAFTSQKKLSAEEVASIRRIIDQGR